MHTHVYTYTCVYIYIYIFELICIYVCVYIYIYILMCIYTLCKAIGDLFRLLQSGHIKSHASSMLVRIGSPTCECMHARSVRFTTLQEAGIFLCLPSVATCKGRNLTYHTLPPPFKKAHSAARVSNFLFIFALTRVSA